MAGKRRKQEEIVVKLRRVEMLNSQGLSMADGIRKIGVTEFGYYRWCKKYGGMDTSQLKEMKAIERLKRLVADLTLDKMILEEATKGNF